MSPFPKLVSYLSIASSIVNALLMFKGIMPPNIAVLLVGLAGVISALSHSLPGSGGKGKVKAEMGLTKNVTTS